jgi:hypothetical protein
MADSLFVGDLGYADKRVSAHVELASRGNRLSQTLQGVSVGRLANVYHTIVNVVLQRVERPRWRAVACEIPQ